MLAASALCNAHMVRASDRIDLEALLGMTELGQWQFSSDGRWLAYELTRPIADSPKLRYYDGRHAGDSRELTIYDVRNMRSFKVPLRSTEVLSIIRNTAGSEAAGMHAWAPDQARLLLLSLRDVGPRIAVLDAVSRRVTDLEGSPGRMSLPFAWLPDGRLLYAVADGQAARGMLMRDERRARDEVAIVRSDHPLVATGPRPSGELRIHDSESGRSRVVSVGEYTALHLAPDGRNLVAFKIAQGDRNSIIRDSAADAVDLFTISAGGLRRTWTYAAPDLQIQSLRWSRDSRSVAILRQSQPSLSDVAIGPPSWIVINLDSGRTSSVAADPEGFAPAASLETTRRARVEVDVEGWVSRINLRHEGGDTELTVLNENLRGRETASFRSVSYVLGGRSFKAWVVVPSRWGGKTKLPGIVRVYAGDTYEDVPSGALPGKQSWPVALNAQLWAAQGYAMIFPSVPLQADVRSNDVIGALVDSVAIAMTAVEQAGIVDPQRLGILGQSQGAYNTAAILSRDSGRYKAGAALAGAFDWASLYGSPNRFVMRGDDEGLWPPPWSSRAWAKPHRSLSRFRAGCGNVDGTVLPEEDDRFALLRVWSRPAWEDPAAYVCNSPYYFAGTLDAPLMIMHGSSDSAFPVEGAVRMYQALKEAGKHPVMIEYPDEGHILQSAAAIRDQWARLISWFDFHLKGERPHASADRPQ